MSCISTHVVHVPLVTDETLLSSPRYGSPEISQLGNCRNSCIDFGDKHLPSGSSQSCSSSQTCSALSTGSAYSSDDEEHIVSPVTEQELLKEEVDAKALLGSLPEGVAIVNERQINKGERIWSGCNSNVHTAIWDNRCYVLKVGRGTFCDVARSEASLLEALMSEDPADREIAEWVIRGRFQLQQEICSVLRCHGLPGIVRCVAIVILDEMSVRVTGMIMDRFGDLGKYCVRSEMLPYAWKLNIALQVARVLELIHARKIIHGDLKLNNVLIGDDDDVYLCDFGCAAFFGDPPPSDSQMGTDKNIAPEIWRGGPKTAATDVFAFGGFLYDLMLQDYRLMDCGWERIEEHYEAGNIFFEEPPKEDWPHEWTDLLLSCMATDPDERPSTSAVVLRLLQMAAMLGTSSGETPA